MNLRFEEEDGKLLLIYEPEREFDVKKHLENFEGYSIKRTFYVTKRDLLDSDENVYRFKIGDMDVDQEYFKLDKSILGTDHDFYLSTAIRINPKVFLATNDVSILRHLDHLVNEDVYIGGDNTQNNIPIEIYEKLIKTFPTRTELTKYANVRISILLKEYFSNLEIYEKNFIKWLQKRSVKDLKLSTKTIPDYHTDFKIQQFTLMKSELEFLLANSAGFTETDWQKRIQRVLLLLFPKYIFSTREAKILGHHDKDKKPDFLLFDANGFIDILEIKKPEAKIMTINPSYRNNYIPVRELTGIIQQMGVYIHSLNTWGRIGEEKLTKKFKKNLPNELKVKILNPQGILLIGRSNDFNEQQKADFEIIKRQFKHISDIMTYDDFLARIKNILAALTSSDSEVKE